MNCSVIRSRLLKAEDPSRPEEDVQAHLGECPDCAAWQRLLVQVEANVPRLPVPLSTGRAAAVQMILNPDAPATPVRHAPPKSAARRSSKHEAPFAVEVEKEFEVRIARPSVAAALNRPPSRRHRLVVGAGVAAAGVLILLSSWWIVHRPGREAALANRARPPVDALVARLVDRDMKLAAAQQPGERVQVLAEIADDIHGETANLVNHAESDDLMHLARLYHRVIHEGVMEQARIVPAEARDDILGPISAQLSRVREDAETTEHAAPAYAGPMRLIADAAREASAQLQVKGSPATTAAPARELPGVDRVRQLQQNRELIERLVQSSLYLAGAVDPLKRADVCGALAKFFALEVGLAATSHDGPRAVELGAHFEDVLKRGVAENLTVARRQIPYGSTRDLEMRRVGREIEEAADPVEKQLRQAGDDPPEMGEALACVRGGRDEVRNVLKTINEHSGRDMGH